MFNSFVRAAIVSCAVAAAGVSQAHAASAQQWREDLDFVVETIKAQHPMWDARVDEAAFDAAAAALRRKISRLSDAERVVEFMRLASMTGDGHTYIDPSNETAVNGAWFPIRFFLFEEGLYITAIAKEMAEFAGARVVSIGGVAAEEAVARVTPLWPSENANAERWDVFLLSNAAIAQTVGLATSAGGLTVEVETREGETRAVTLQAIQEEQGFGYRSLGEFAGPFVFDDERAPVTAFDERPPGDYFPTIADFEQGPPTDLPLHLRYRRGYRVDYLPEHNAIYFIFNAVARSSTGGNDFAGVTDEIFNLVEERNPDKLIIDIRNNRGGNGAIIKPFVHELIKHDAINQPGKIVVITGRQSFSAAIAPFLGLLKQHAHVVTIGEPPGAGLNSFGNAESFPLPNSDLSLHVSAVYHQYTEWSETPGRDAGFMPVDFPAFPTAQAYFAGGDAALELILSGADLRPLWAVADEDDAATLRAVFEARKEKYGHFDWWRPVEEAPMNSIGNDLRREGRFDQAIAALTINTQVYPQSWNTWDSLGEAYYDSGDFETAKRFYENSLEVNPGNGNGRSMLEAIAEKMAEAASE